MLNSLNNIAQHCSLLATDSVLNVADPFLQAYDLNHFSYVRSLPSQSRFCLTTHPAMTLDFYQYKFHDVLDYEVDFSQHESAHLLWLHCNEKEQRLMKHTRDYYSIANGIVLINNQPDYQEQIYFGTTPDNYAANNFYINNLELLANFVAVFKEKLAPIIAQCQQQPIPTTYATPLGSSRDIYRTRQHLSTQLAHLSPREQQLLALMARGHSCQFIAQRLAIKVKTVYFYLENLKKKLGLFSKDQLVNYYWQNQWAPPAV